MNKPVQALYIHIPFCEAICDYCDFPKLQYFRIFAEKYITCLEKEMESYHIDHPLKTIYIGGGTPTCLEDDLFEKLLKIVSRYLDGVIEYTIEANPESLSVNKLKLMKKYGVTRLSIGVESTDDQILKAINRHQTFEDVKIAIKNAKELGFDNLSVDLIIGLPHVLKDGLYKDLKNILSLDVKHISCYSLSVHPNTVFGNKGIKEATGDIERDLYDIVDKELTKNGFIHYEISNWAKPGYESRHNFVYWQDEQYYGVGMGASGYINNRRYTNTRSINAYLDGKTVDYEEMININDDKDYFVMLNLRTNQGMSLSEYKARFNEDLLISKKDTIEEFEKYKLIIVDRVNNKLICTYEGMMILDQIVLQLLA